MIENPQAVRFCNEKLRPLASKITDALRMARNINEEWDMLGMSKYFPSKSDEVIDDKANVDGRPIITAKNVNDFAILVKDFISFFDNNSKLNLSNLSKINPGGS